MKKNKLPTQLSEKDIIKIEVARELGIWDQIENEGWKSLSNAMCGKVGGLMSKKLRKG